MYTPEKVDRVSLLKELEELNVQEMDIQTVMIYAGKVRQAAVDICSDKSIPITEVMVNYSIFKTYQELLEKTAVSWGYVIRDPIDVLLEQLDVDPHMVAGALMNFDLNTLTVLYSRVKEKFDDDPKKYEDLINLIGEDFERRFEDFSLDVLLAYIDENKEDTEFEGLSFILYQELEKRCKGEC